MKFDKDKAKKAFSKEHPQWERAMTRNRFEISSDDIQKIIDLWPDTPSAVISGIIGINYGTLCLVATRIRKSGIILTKNDHTQKKKIDDAIKGLKKEG